jgi:hypothetical protein
VEEGCEELLGACCQFLEQFTVSKYLWICLKEQPLASSYQMTLLIHTSTWMAMLGR